MTLACVMTRVVVCFAAAEMSVFAQEALPAKQTDASIPAEVFQLKVDGFKQVSGVLVDCGSLSAPIRSIAANPAPAADEGFSFVASEGALTLRLATVAKAKAKSVDLGGFTWDGADLKWSIRTFPRSEIGKGFDKASAFLSICSFVATLADGSTVRLSPPGMNVAAMIKAEPRQVFDDTVVFAGLPAEALLNVVMCFPGQWKEITADLGRTEGKIDDTIFEIEAMANTLAIREISPMRAKLRNLQGQLSSDRALLPSLPEDQRAILAADCEKLAREIDTVSKEVQAHPPKGMGVTLQIRASSPLSGRVFGDALVELKR